MDDSGFLLDFPTDEVVAPFDSMEIEFKIEMKLESWQILTIIGSTDELGHWSDGKRALMQRGENNIWSLKVKFRQPVFRYKYATMD